MKSGFLECAPNPSFGSVTSGLERMVISPAHSAPCLPSKNGRLVPIPRPDGGGSLGANKTLRLCVNNFSLRFDEKMILYHYDADVKQENLPVGSAAPEISKSDLSAVKRELFRAYAAEFPVQTAAYDGQRNLFSPELLLEETFPVLVRGHEFSVTLKLVKTIPLRELIQTPCPREILQGLDIVMRHNSCRGRISICRSFYSEHDQTDRRRHRHHHTFIRHRQFPRAACGCQGCDVLRLRLQEVHQHAFLAGPMDACLLHQSLGGGWVLVHVTDANTQSSQARGWLTN